MKDWNCNSKDGLGTRFTTRKSSQVSSVGLPGYQMLTLLLLALALVAEGGWIDMDTPLDKRTTKSLVDGSTYDLVMSDEFNVEGRTFKDGHDKMWTALDKSDDDSSSAGGGSLQFYNSSNVITANGSMIIKTTLGRTSWTRYDHIKKKWKTENTYFKSGMVQSWNKFCFTGGIVEIDLTVPGNPFVGGLWPAVWLLGNIGRATYEASTNNIWPWSFDKCDRHMQDRQTISACNRQNHYGLHPYQGRGATEIDIIEVMTGDSHGPFKTTEPPVGLPYADMTLQVAPGIEKNRPQSGFLPKKNSSTVHGFAQSQADRWYEGIEYAGNTSINPFFYGTYLAETKPGEPVTRNKRQAFQADAVGVVHQLVPAHFEQMFTLRLEWQPGPTGRLDWYAKGYKKLDGYGKPYYVTGDGQGKDWVPVFSITDEVLNKTMGSQIPIEPSSLIMNTAISSTWGFPYDLPDYCKKCYDCDDPTCTCSFHPGFCQVLRMGDVAMKIDFIRVYQSNDPSAHVGQNHTVGCDPPEFPTREFIKGHEYRYMRNPPFSYDDLHPLRRVQQGGGACKKDADCGSNIVRENLTATYEAHLGGAINSARHDKNHQRHLEESEKVKGQGRCVSAKDMPGMFSMITHASPKVCHCNPGFTGPHCHAEDFIDDSPSAEGLKRSESPFLYMVEFQATPFMMIAVVVMLLAVLVFLCARVRAKTIEIRQLEATRLRRPRNVTTTNSAASGGEDQSLLATGGPI